MQYLGGKYRIAARIRDAILSSVESRETYIEPFIGGGATFERLTPHFKRAIGADVSLDLVLMWQALLDGWEPPSDVTEDEYHRLRNSEPSALRGFVGYGCSFGGKWFGGFARSRNGAAPNYNYAAGAARSVKKTAEAIRIKSDVIHCDYRDLRIPPGSVVYADPPYANTTGYGNIDGFDVAEFWNVAASWAAAGCTVFVSEHSAPVGWRSIWSQGLPDYLRGKQSPGARREQLFVMSDGPVGPQ